MKRQSRSGEEPAQARPAGRARRLLRFVWRWVLRPPLALGLLILALVWGDKAFHAIRSTTLTENEKLLEDLSRLQRVLLLEHPAPFLNAPRQEIQEAFGRARAAIARHQAGGIGRERVVAHFAEVVASLRDPHTTFSSLHEQFGILPVSLALFGDQVRLQAAADPRDLGARVLSFDGVPTPRALERVRPLVADANPSSFLDGAPSVLRSPGLLHHLDIADEPGGVTLQLLRTDGSRTYLSLPRLTLEEYRQQRPSPYAFDEDLLPLYRRTDRGAYWFEVLPDRAAIYVRCAGLSKFVDSYLGELAHRLLAERQEVGSGLVVVDLRGNPGGNPHAHIPLVAALAASPATRGPENLRVLVDRGTYSAAILAAADLERRAGALIVGEEPGDNAHLTTDARPFTLRHTGVEVWVPNALMQTAGGAGGRARLIPVRPVSPTFADWLAGQDPALDAALEPLETLSGEGGEQLQGALPTGRFALDEQRTLTVMRADTGYSASVTGLGSDPLTGDPRGDWVGGIHAGLRATSEGRLELRLPTGAWTALPRRNAPAPLELVMEGRVADAIRAYRELTANGTDRRAVAALGLVNEGIYRYVEGASGQGRNLLDLAHELSPADPLIPLQHSLLRQRAEGRWLPPAGELLHAITACGRRYAGAEVINDMWLCI